MRHRSRPATIRLFKSRCVPSVPECPIPRDTWDTSEPISLTVKDRGSFPKRAVKAREGSRSTVDATVLLPLSTDQFGLHTPANGLAANLPGRSGTLQRRDPLLPKGFKYLRRAGGPRPGQVEPLVDRRFVASISPRPATVPFTRPLNFRGCAHCSHARGHRTHTRAPAAERASGRIAQRRAAPSVARAPDPHRATTELHSSSMSSHRGRQCSQPPHRCSISSEAARGPSRFHVSPFEQWTWSSHKTCGPQPSSDGLACQRLAADLPGRSGTLQRRDKFLRKEPGTYAAQGAQARTGRAACWQAS